MINLKEIEKKYYPIYWRIVTDNEDEFIGGVEIDANSNEEVWDQLKKLIKIEEAK